MTITNFQEKILLLLETIDDLRAITPNGRYIHLDPDQHLNAPFLERDLAALLDKLEKDEKIIQLERYGPGPTARGWTAGGEPCRPNGSYSLKVTERFDKYLDRIQEWFAPPNSEEKDEPKTDPEPVQDSKPEPKKPDEIVLKATYTETREVRINDEIVIASPNFASQNDQICLFLFKNPNRICTKEEIEKFVGERLKKDLFSTLNRLGFIGDLKKAFFSSVTKDRLYFRNPVTRAFLRESRLDEVRFLDKYGKSQVITLTPA